MEPESRLMQQPQTMIMPQNPVNLKPLLKPYQPDKYSFALNSRNRLKPINSYNLKFRVRQWFLQSLSSWVKVNCVRNRWLCQIRIFLTMLFPIIDTVMSISIHVKPTRWTLLKYSVFIGVDWTKRMQFLWFKMPSTFAYSMGLCVFRDSNNLGTHCLFPVSRPIICPISIDQLQLNGPQHGTRVNNECSKIFKANTR